MEKAQTPKNDLADKYTYIVTSKYQNPRRNNREGLSQQKLNLIIITEGPQPSMKQFRK